MLPGFGIDATYCEINAASKPVTVPLPLTSAAAICVEFSVIRPATCCAIIAESNPVIEGLPGTTLTSPVLDGVTVYGPAPIPESVYAPVIKAEFVDTVGDPTAVKVVFGTGRVVGAFA